MVGKIFFSKKFKTRALAQSAMEKKRLKGYEVDGVFETPRSFFYVAEKEVPVRSHNRKGTFRGVMPYRRAKPRRFRR